MRTGLLGRRSDVPERSGHSVESPAGGGSASQSAAGPAEPPVEARAEAADGARSAPYQPPSWEEIVAEHSARVYRLAYRLTGNQHDAEDLTQETFVRVFRSLSSFTPGTFEGWLHRITTNLFLDLVRRRRRIRMDPLGDDADHVPGNVGPGSPERGYEHANLDHDVQRALDELSPEFRAAVVLCDIEGLSYEEIALTLGVKLGTVRSRIHRARGQLRTALAHRAPGGIGLAATVDDAERPLEHGAHLPEEPEVGR